MIVQGSGWGWLGYNKASKALEIATCANQDPLAAKVRHRPGQARLGPRLRQEAGIIHLAQCWSKLDQSPGMAL